MNPFRRLANLRPLVASIAGVPRLERDLEQVGLAIGKMEARRVRAQTYENLREAEFRVFSQWGEDGIIQYLLGKVSIENDVFVELGVEDYYESNTRFLLQNDNWRGVILDAGDAHLRFVRQRGLDWRHDLRAVQAFITRENIDPLLGDAGLSGDIGLLSIDVDGNDYWVLEGIRRVMPRILIVEYNSVFGPDAAVTIPYDPGFDRTRSHRSNLYWGASLRAITSLAEGRGYRLIGSNSAGSNAFFVRADVLGGLRPLSSAEGWIRSRFREERDEKGSLTLADSHREGLGRISHLPVVHVETGKTLSIAEAVSGTING